MNVFQKFLVSITPVPAIPIYFYGWQRHPFDDRQVVSFEANSLTEANVKAIAFLEDAFKNHKTVVNAIWPITDKVYDSGLPR